MAMTAFQYRFVEELIKEPTGNAAAAYRNAGGSTKYAKQSAIKLLKHPKISEGIARQQELLEQKAAYGLVEAHEGIRRGMYRAESAADWLRGVEMLIQLHGLNKS